MFLGQELALENMAFTIKSQGIVRIDPLPSGTG